MNRVFVDTSALLALLVATDENHDRARSVFEGLKSREAALVTTSYVLVETYALLGRRLGRDAVRSFRESFAPLLEVLWVDRAVHEKALDLLLAREGRRLSLVDAASFVVMRTAKLEEAFAFDRDFEREGFHVL